MAFEPTAPQEARGDQFETATPNLDQNLNMVLFNYGGVHLHKEEPTDETRPTELAPVPDLEFRSVSDPDGPTAAALFGLVVSHMTGSHPDEVVEGSGVTGLDGAPPTVATDQMLDVRTDEAEIGSTEPPTTNPDSKSQETWYQVPKGSFEGSGSGEDEASGLDLYAPEMAGLTTPASTLSTVHIGTAKVRVAVASTEPGSGEHQLSEEVSRKLDGLVDPRVGVAGIQTTTEVTAEPSRTTYIHGQTTAKPSTTSSAHIGSSASSLSVHSSQSVPWWVLVPDPSATILPEDNFLDYDNQIHQPVLVMSRPQVPAKTTESSEDLETTTEETSAVDLGGT